MESVFSTDDLPKRRLIVQTTIANRFAAGAGREISVMREKVARDLAQKCVECDDLVQIVADGPFLKLSADCIVLTQEELADLMRKQFRAGLSHAREFMPVYESSTDAGVRDKAFEQAAQLFPQPHEEYFGSEIQDSIRALKSSPQAPKTEGSGDAE